MKKILTLATVIVMLSATSVLAQDLCDSYHDKYRVCVEAREAGSNVDYDDCATYTNDTDCENAGCFWNDQGLPPPGRCVTAICNGDLEFSGRVSGSDLYVFKGDLGRVVDCPITPNVPAPVPVPKTGQTTSYATGDDGDHEKGVEWPTPRFTDNGDGTVTDNLTGLMWTEDAQQISGAVNWNDAIDGCNSLDYAGYDDWRLPNRKELESLLDFSQYNPVLSSGHPFDNVQSSYWSATTNASFTVNAWLVFVSNGDVGSTFKSVSNYVWPVRGGQ